MFEFKIDLINEHNLSNFIININGTEHIYGEFILTDLDDTITMLKYCCTHSNIFPHFTFTEVIHKCNFFTDEEKEYCILKYV